MMERTKVNSHSSQNRDEAKYECPKCKDLEGYYEKIPQRYKNLEYLVDKWVDCECVKKKRNERLFAASAITEEFSKKTFGNFDVGTVPEIVREAFSVSFEYVKGFKTIQKERQNSIALLGRPGCGKTHLLMATANNLLSKGIEVIYFPWVEGFNEIKSDLKNLDDRIRRFQRTEVLFIDDMWKGSEEPSAFEIKQSFAIINYRYLNNLPVMISSERDFMKMCEYDEALGSRMKEMCKGHTVTIKGSIELNYRLRD